MTQNSKETRERPGWRGPGGVSKKVSSGQKSKAGPSSQPKKTPDSADAKPTNLIPLALQQLLLNIFRDRFPEILQDEKLKPLLQEIKTALYERDFARAFGRTEFLEAYAVRWSAGRSLGYAECLVGLGEHLEGVIRGKAGWVRRGRENGGKSGDGVGAAEDDAVRVVCLGGGAAEVIAFGGLTRHLSTSGKAMEEEECGSVTEVMKSLSFSPSLTPLKMEILLIDSADWSAVIQKLATGLTSSPPLSKYASASAKASNSPLLGANSLVTTFQQSDLLAMTKAELEKAFGDRTSLITLLFTLNELYTTSITKTTAFLLDLTAATVPGTLLLVMDSPGSYSEASLGKLGEKKKYPMQWLMDRTLLDGGEGKMGEDWTASWQKEVGDESRWFRLGEELRYPISLENMRYQVHLFRRI